MNKLTSRDKNILRREGKKHRIAERKLDGTYKVNREYYKPIITKWGIPYYEKVKVETPWKLYQGKNSKFSFWINPETHRIIEAYDYVGTPPPHVSYKWISNMPFADISP